MTPERFSVTYRITVRDNRSIEEHARDIAIEQTVETPADCLPQRIVDEGITGRVERIVPVSGKTFDAVISFRADVTGFTIPQFLNVLFGNISIKNNIRIVDIALCDSLYTAFVGPEHGVPGLRKMLGVYDRPLASTAIKPMGLSVTELAAMVGSMARGGIDIIKDDHGIADQHFHPFRERVARCQEAVAHANASTGRLCRYFPMISGRFEEVEGQVQWAVAHGVKGILIAPFLVGPDTVRYLSRKYRVVIMGHPALAGTFFHDRTHGMPPSVLLGTIFRLIGCDISVFPHSGGRFSFTEDECRDLATALRESNGPWKAAFPCPAGGMNLDRIAAMSEMYGADTCFLIGGALLKHSDNLEASTRVFMERIRAHFPERLEQPTGGKSRSVGARRQGPADVLRNEDYRWTDRTAVPYKSEESEGYCGITRQELVGKFGEQTRFDLRYFEILPGGHSSKEKHLHEHTIIGVRGLGVLVREGQETVVGVHDVARVAALQPHQLRATGEEPFGFFCIVDHDRDAPVAVA